MPNHSVAWSSWALIDTIFGQLGTCYVIVFKELSKFVFIGVLVRWCTHNDGVPSSNLGVATISS